MAEPITSLELFREQYTRKYPRASETTVKREWVKYKSAHALSSPVLKSPTTKAKSPIRVSPRRKKSPERYQPSIGYGGMVQPTLLGVPPDVSRLLVRELPRSAIGRLSRVSRASKHMTQQRLSELCKELPTEKEVTEFILDSKTRFSPLSVRHIHLMPDGALLTELELFFTHEDEGRQAGQYATKTYIELGAGIWDEPGQETVLEVKEQVYRSSITGVMTLQTLYHPPKGFLAARAKARWPKTETDPITMLRLLRQRLGCRNKAKEYGLDIITAYYRTILHPYLVRLLSLERADIYVEDYVVGDLSSVTETSINDVIILYLLAKGWLGINSMDDLVDFLSNLPYVGPTTIELLRAAVTDLIAHIRTADVYYASVLAEIQQAEVLNSPQLPGNKEVVEVLMQGNNTTTNIRFRIVLLNIEEVEVYVLEYYYTYKERQYYLHRSGIQSVSREFTPYQPYLLDSGATDKVRYILRTKHVEYALDIASIKLLSPAVSLKSYVKWHMLPFVRGLIEDPYLEYLFDTDRTISTMMLQVLSKDESDENEEEASDEEEEPLQEDHDKILAEYYYLIQKLGLVMYYWLYNGSDEEKASISSPYSRTSDTSLYNQALEMLTKLRKVYKSLQ